MKNAHLNKERRFVSCKAYFPEGKAAVDEKGIVKAYVAIFGNVDYGGDVIEPGAFAESLNRKMPKVIWHHQWESPIGVTTVAKEVMPGDPSLPVEIRANGGLYVEGKLTAGVQKADEARLLMIDGAIDEFSFGYFVEDGFLDKDGHFHMTKIWIFEWSPVLVGMNDKTVLVEAKDLDGKKKDGEGVEPKADEEKPKEEGATGGEEGDTIPEDKAIAALSINSKTITRAIKALTDALKALEGADNQAGKKVETPSNRAASKKVSVRIFNKALRELRKAKSEITA